MNADGSDAQQIVRSGTSYDDYLPAWSLDNEWIVFNQRCLTSFCEPYLMRVAAANRSSQQGTRLQLGASAIENAAFSFDGFWLVYEGNENGQDKDILFMTASGGTRTPLTINQGLEFDPAWRPQGSS
jgi:Tol biopolymer transport system component